MNPNTLQDTRQPLKHRGHEEPLSPRTIVLDGSQHVGDTHKSSTQTPTSSHSKYTQFVTTLVDSSTNKLVQIMSQPPPDYVAAKKRRNRVTISCMSCKRRKVKCDRERPICGSCKKHDNVICVYSKDETDESNKVRKQESIESSTNEHMNFPATIFDSETNGTVRVLSTDDDHTDSARISSNDNVLNNLDESIEKGETNKSTLNSDDEPAKNHNDSADSERIPTLEFTALLKALDKLKQTHIQNDEIDQLRQKIEQLRFYLDDTSIVQSNILKGLPLIRNLILHPVLKTDATVSLNSFNLQFGASSITSYVSIDYYMGALFRKALPKIEEDIKKWKSCFSVDIYRKALEKYIVHENFDLDVNLSLDDVKRSKFRFICKLLETYFIDYKTFRALIDKSTPVMIAAVPVVPKKLLEMFLRTHFVESEDDGKLKIVNVETDEDFSEIILIVAVLRFGLPKSENVIITPDEINYVDLLDRENINTDHKTDLLNSFLKIILNETDLTQKYNIPMLGTLIILFMIAYTHRFNFKSGNTGVGLNYGIVAVYMAVNLGIYAKTGYAYSKEQKRVYDHQTQVHSAEPTLSATGGKDYMKYLEKDGFHNIWNLVMFIDTFSSFNSGIPQLISSNMDNIFVTKFVDENCAQICKFYRKSFKLANSNITKGQEVSIIEYERFVIEFENFIVLKMKPASVCVQMCDLVGVATSIRSLNLLLFLYYNGYFSFVNTVEDFKAHNDELSNPNYHSIIDQFDALEKRLFNRGIKLSIVSLIDLNIMLVSMFSEKDGSFYEKYSFDLIQIFTRIIYTLTTFICKMITIQKSDKSYLNTHEAANEDSHNKNGPNFNFLFDISRRQSEELSRYFVARQCSQSLGEEWASGFSAETVQLSDSIDKLCENPKAMIELMIGFFFNTSQSLISQNFIFYALYKYFVMAVKEYNDTPGSVEDFDIDRFSSHYSYVDCTWFINK